MADLPKVTEEHFVERSGVTPAAKNAGLSVLRTDDISSTGVIIEEIRAAIQNARVCIADMTGANPNVMYEIGLAQAMGKPVVVITQDIAELPSDLVGIAILPYRLTADGLQQLREGLEEALVTTLEEGRIEEADRLIDAGAYAASVAVSSVLLEQALRRRLGASFSGVGDRVRRPLSLGQLAAQAEGVELLRDNGRDEMRRAVKLRNSTVHGLREPTREDAEFMLNLVARLAP